MTKDQKKPKETSKPRVKRKEVRRRILDSAGILFMDRGLDATSLNAVAEAAGFSKGAVYSNFANKDELVFELLSSGIDERISAVENAVSQEHRTELHGLIAGERLIDIIESEPRWQIFFVELWLRCVRKPALRLRFAKKRRLMRARVAALLQTHAEASNYRLPISAEYLASYVLALSNGFGIERLIDDGAVPSDLMGKILNWTFRGMTADLDNPTEP